MVRKIVKRFFNLRQRIYIKGIIPNLKFKLKSNPIIIYNKKKYEIKIFKKYKKNVFNGYYDINPLKEEKMLVHINKNNDKTSNKCIEIGYYDINNRNYKNIITTKAWSWQQGSRLRWSNLLENVINYNDWKEEKYCNIFYNIKDKKIIKKIDFPLYDMTKDEKYGLSINFSRLQRLRPGYGYNVLPDKTENEKAPKNDGIFLIDINNNTSKLIIPLDKLAKTNDIKLEYEHYINHISISPNGRKFIFFHIYNKKNGGWITQLCSSNIDGTDLKILDNINLVSHYTWKNDKEILITGIEMENNKFFYKQYDIDGKYIKDITKNELEQDGHPTYIDENNFISDTYPKNFYQTLFKYNIYEKKRIDIVKLYSDPRLDGEYRCDLHPKYDDKNNIIFIDSTYAGKNRRIISIKEVNDGK